MAGLGVRWFSDRQKGKARRSTPRQLCALRLADIARLIRARHGIVLPDNADGRVIASIALHHQAALHGESDPWSWLELWAPWLRLGEAEAMIGRLKQRKVWKADELGAALGVTAQERRRLGLTTIGACDETSAERIARRRAADRDRKRAQRYLKGQVSRQEYLAKSMSSKRPWEAEGISRATWYRRRSEVS